MLKTLDLYKALTIVGYPLIAAYLAVRKAHGKEDLDRFSERMGFAQKQRPEGRLIWIHGASVGETLSVLPLINKISESYPDLHIMVTSGTVTSARLMGQRLKGNAFHQYIPVDCVSQVHRFVNHWKPDAVFWIESEFWPNLLTTISEHNVPLVLINGRVSDRSFRRWQKMPRFCRELQSLFTKSFGQTDEDARRLKILGAQQTECVGNMKFGVGELPYDDQELLRLKSQIAERPCWVAASTHAGEETLVVKAHKELKQKYPAVLTVLAPRHPNRCDEIEEMIKQSGLTVARRSKGEDITPQTDIYLADTIGEMGLFYRLAPIAFVGGSMIPFGGQNIIEPARLKKAVVCGRYMMNFKEIVAQATAENALSQVNDTQQLVHVIDNLLSDAVLLGQKQEKALKFAVAQANVLDRLVSALTPYLEFSERNTNAD